jgi:hypothetical protein
MVSTGRGPVEPAAGEVARVPLGQQGSVDQSYGGK